jgi:hypothetical protein
VAGLAVILAGTALVVLGDRTGGIVEAPVD